MCSLSSSSLAGQAQALNVYTHNHACRNNYHRSTSTRQLPVLMMHCWKLRLPSKNFQLHVHVHACTCTVYMYMYVWYYIHACTCNYMYKNTQKWMDHSEPTPWSFQPVCVHSEAAQWQREGHHRRCTSADPWTAWERSERRRASSIAQGSSPPQLGSWTDPVLDSPWWGSYRWQWDTHFVSKNNYNLSFTSITTTWSQSCTSS